MCKRRGIRISIALAVPLIIAGFSTIAFGQETAAEGETASSIGPDVVVSSLQFSQIIPHAYQNTPTGYITGLSVGTQSCNIGTAPLSWQPRPSTNHPVIRTSMYRLKDGRFEQIGMSWVKHGYFATNEPICNSLCSAPGGDGYNLYPGCGDPYSAQLNSIQSDLGATWQINAHTGGITTPFQMATSTGQNGRLQVHNVDMDPAQNVGARYYVAGQYISADDAAAGNGDNNFSFHRVVVVAAPTFPEDGCSGTDPQRFCPFYVETMFAQQAPIRAWKINDPQVVETNVRVPGEGLFILAAKATDLGTGYWRYEYALQNVNSDRSGKAVTIPTAVGSTIQNAGFHDVEYHSGEPFSNDDWTITVLSGKIIWSTQDHATNPNANALRWGTLYNYRFDANAPPGNSTIVLDLFKPGAPEKVNISTIGPLVGLIDCNENGIPDGCDVSCAGAGCSQPCGTSDDCNSNSVPDECETDCNNNGIADTCDLVPIGSSLDCNSNTVPDECEEDCDGNGVPDNCVPIGDSDGDGFDDCNDDCPFTTPPAGCQPPPFSCCRFPSGIHISQYPYTNCVSQGGTPLCNAENSGTCSGNLAACPTTFCRQGCMVGDGDGDGDFDLGDVQIITRCFSGEIGSPAFVQPSIECLTAFDYDGDGAVDLEDYELFRRGLNGPE